MSSFKDAICNSEDYRKSHRFCPKCGCPRIMMTLACYYGDVNENDTRCHCGWNGIVHDLIDWDKAKSKSCGCDRCVELAIEDNGG